MELTHRLVDARGETLARLAIARDFRSRLIGLMGRRPEAETGLWFPGVNSIHMLFMRTPIDVLFLEKADDAGVQRLCGVRIGLRPWVGLALSPGASDTIEIAPGSNAGRRLAIGDRVRVLPLEDQRA